MKNALTLLLSASLLFLTSPAFAADLSVSATPENGDAATEKNIADAYTLATTLPGITAYNFTATWDELSNPDASHVTELKIAAHFGGEAKIPAYLGLKIVNGTERGLPKDMRRSRWSHPELVVKLDTLLRNMQNTTGSNVKWFTIGHQADLYFVNHPDELADFLAFYKTASSTIRRLYPAAKIGIAVTHEGLTSRKEITDQLIGTSDAAFISYAPVTPEFIVKEDADIGKELKALVETPFNKPIVLVDVGYPTSRKADGTEKAQAHFIETYLPVLKSSPAVDLVNVSPLHDMSEETCKSLQNQMGFKGRGFAAAYCSAGLIEIDGKEKPGFKALKKAIKPSLQNKGQAPTEPK